jgi:DNA-binding NarL/FixJ family response regulator
MDEGVHPSPDLGKRRRQEADNEGGRASLGTQRRVGSGTRLVDSIPAISKTPCIGHERQTGNGMQPRAIPHEAVLKVLIVDGHPIMLMGLRCVLQSDPGIELVGACDTGGQALEVHEATRPALVITDVTLPDMTGIELCRAIKQKTPDADVLILTASNDNASVFGSIGAGASGYVLKDIPPENLLRAVHSVRRGQTMVHPGITRRMLDRLSLITRDGNGGLLFGEKLTEREAEILVEVAKGSTNKEIAHKLFIAESTVKSRLHSIFSKIEVHDRAQAIAFAIREGYVR